ncbi:CLUMA_CG011846, isoform A [Clunio marinus]|uniref:CLUMA_CG011846, isoform A n=1 Tax=Clunio marinus TaxID=568069 RepID=A0A1J1IJ74_9DIPT|nr:CLUMA_CG011846, isoform A [Clunio marinus]
MKGENNEKLSALLIQLHIMHYCEKQSEINSRRVNTSQMTHISSRIFAELHVIPKVAEVTTTPSTRLQSTREFGDFIFWFTIQVQNITAHQSKTHKGFIDEK